MHSFLLIYAIVFGALILLSGIAKVVLKFLGKYDGTPTSVQRKELVTFPLIIIPGVIAMFADLFHIPLVDQLFWQLFAAIFIVHGVAALWFPKQQWLKSKLSAKSYLKITVVTSAVGLPMYYLVLSYPFLSYPSVPST